MPEGTLAAVSVLVVTDERFLDHRRSSVALHQSLQIYAPRVDCFLQNTHFSSDLDDTPAQGTTVGDGHA